MSCTWKKNERKIINQICGHLTLARDGDRLREPTRRHWTEHLEPRSRRRDSTSEGPPLRAERSENPCTRSVEARALASGRRDGTGGLSPRTVTHMHRVLKQSLNQAVKSEMLNRNPADAVDPPKVERRIMQTYDLEQTAALIDAMRGARLLVPMLLAVLCGLRCGEIVALKWKNVDLSNDRLAEVESAEQVGTKVRHKPPKNGRGRQLALSARLVDELAAHRIRQAEELLALGVRLTDDSFVVAQADGSPIQPNTLTQDWNR